MYQYVIAFVTFFLYLYMYYLFGAAVSRLLRLKNDPINELLYGLFVYAFIFFLYVLPLKLFYIKVDIIGRIWLIFLFIAAVTIHITHRKYLAEGWKNLLRDWKSHKLVSSVVFLFTMGQMTFVEMYGRLYGGYNQTWFTGFVSNGAAYNRLMLHDPATGLPVTLFDNSRYLCTFLDHSAVFCRLFHMNAMVEVRTVETAIFIIFQNIVLWKLCKLLAKGKMDHALFGFFVCWTLKNIMVRSQLLPGFYTYFRTYEGKSFVINVSVPLLIYLMWKMHEEPENKGYLGCSIITLVGSMTYSLSMMFSYPFLLTAFVPFLLTKKGQRKPLIRNVLILGLIGILYFIVYILGKKEILDLSITFWN